MKLKGKAAVVTGGSLGIGKATALRLAREGCDVAICARTEKDLKMAKKEIEKEGVTCLAIKADVSKPADVRRAIDKTLKGLGKIDFLINNAGVALYKPVSETSEKEWDSIMNTNLKGVFLFTREALKHMREGVIVNISSGAGKAGFPLAAAYCASKFGVIGFTESLAGEVADHGIRVYAICPGGTDTRMYREVFGGRPRTKPEYVADKIVELCLIEQKKPSGSSIEIYKLWDYVDYLKRR